MAKKKNSNKDPLVIRVRQLCNFIQQIDPEAYEDVKDLCDDLNKEANEVLELINRKTNNYVNRQGRSAGPNDRRAKRGS